MFWVSLLHLRRKVEGQKEGQLSFLKANVGSVMDQVDTIVALKEKFEKDTAFYGTEPTLKLEKSIKGKYVINLVYMTVKTIFFRIRKRSEEII